MVVEIKDSRFVDVMKCYTKMSRAELVARLKALESKGTAAGPGRGGKAGAGAERAGMALSESEGLLRAILKSAVEGIITIDEGGVIESINPAAERAFGYRAEEVLGRNVSMLMPSPYREEHNDHIARYIGTGEARIIGIGRETVGQRKDGTVFPIDLSVSEVRLSGRRLFTGFIRDITERKRAEEQVNLVQSVVERGFSAVLIASADFPDPQILYINPTFAQLTGYSPEKIVGQPLSALGELTAVLERLRKGVPGEERLEEEVSAYQTGGSEHWGEWRVGPVRDKTGRITHWLVILRDITERRRLEKEILEISDREQRRIGQDLHDGLCQQLAGIELMSQVLEQKLAPRSRADAARVGEIAGHVRDAISQTRLLARGLSPVTLESEGLMSALQELASNTVKIFHIGCRFECSPPVLVHDPTAATHLFRVAQEAVSNAIKHGKATQVLIGLNRQRGRVVLTVSDNGGGFPKIIPTQKGMGLRIMQSRAGMIGGTLVTENNPAGGARVICSVALKADPGQNGGSHERKKDKSKG
jgi:PAS domain S-box-containing protein